MHKRKQTVGLSALGYTAAADIIQDFLQQAPAARIGRTFFCKCRQYQADIVFCVQPDYLYPVSLIHQLADIRNTIDFFQVV
ncbi:hypothetical protein D3C81_2052250 [compost metagenome]